MTILVESSSHYRKPLHPNNKTDDNDLEAIFHAAINGYADLFEDDKLFNKSIAMAIAKQFSSAEKIKNAKADGMAAYLRKIKVRFQAQTLDKMYVWSLQAAEADPMQSLLTEQWKQLLQLRSLATEQIPK